jgi:D-amino peptidase
MTQHPAEFSTGGDMSASEKAIRALILGSVLITLLATRPVDAEPYELTESEVADLAKFNIPEVSLFGIKLGDPEERVKENLIKIKIPGVKVEVQDVYVMLYDKRNPSNAMAGIRLTDGKVDYIFVNQRFAHLAAGVLRQVLRGEGADEARKLLGKEDFAEDQTTFSRLNYKGGSMVIVFSGRDITVEFNSSA